MKPAEADAAGKGRPSGTAVDPAVVPRVLLVDDDVDFASDVRHALASVARVTHAKSTAEAAAELLRQPYDLLWLDLDLDTFFGTGTGVEAAAFLRAVHERICPGQRTIIVSACSPPLARALLKGLAVCSPPLSPALRGLSAFRLKG